MLKKRFQKIIVCAVSALMVVSSLGLTTTAFAASDTSGLTGTVKVSGVESGVTVSAYKLMTADFDSEPKDPPYYWDSAFTTWIKSNYSSYIGSNNQVTSAFSSSLTDAQKATFYDKLAAAIKDGTITATAAKSITGNGNIEGLAIANYLIVTENGYKIYKASAVNVVPTYSNGTWSIANPAATVTVKASEPSIDKKINESTTSDGHNADTSDNGNIGDTINYDLRSDIPSYPDNALAKEYVVSDTLSAGLTLVSSSIKVYGVTAGGTETLLTKDTDYTQSAKRPSTLGTSTFSLAFNYDKIKSYAKIHVDFNATLNSNAVIGTGGNLNTAYLDYSNNPYTTNSYKTKTDSVKYYSYGAEVTKVDKDNHATVLAGAEFQIAKDKNFTTASTLKFAGTTGSYKHNGTVTNLVTDSNGKVKVTGLDAGTYYLKEVKAPGGYSRTPEIFTITITDANFDGTIESGSTTISTGITSLTVENSKPFILPTTGGIGTVIFTGMGIILIGAGVTIMAINRRKKNNEDAKNAAA